MPRKPRVHVPGGIYHVILRGNGRQTIFFTDLDRRRWMRLLAHGIERYQCRVHAYCWMTNHIHMAVQVSDLPLGRLIGWVASQYAKYINKRLRRSGHFFERRYRSKLVAADEYLLQLVRYIHLNPVVAGIVGSPDRYPWSSHRAYIGYRRDSWLTTDMVLSVFATNKRQAIDAYRAFFCMEDHESNASFSNVSSDEINARDDDYDAAIQHQNGDSIARKSLGQLIDEHCSRHNVCEDELASPRRTRRNARLRAEIAITAQQFGVATLHEIATRFNRSDSTLCHAIRHLINNSPSDEQ